jgi:hypothetical protein
LIDELSGRQIYDQGCGKACESQGCKCIRRRETARFVTEAANFTCSIRELLFFVVIGFLVSLGSGNLVEDADHALEALTELTLNVVNFATWEQTTFRLPQWVFIPGNIPKG